MKRTLPYERVDPRVVHIPSAEARSVEAALERIAEDLARRHDLWLVSFPTVAHARALRQRLDEEVGGRTVALVALVEELDRKPSAQAVALAGRALKEGLEGVFPTSGPQEELDQAVFDLLERQRALLAYRGVRGRRKAAAAEQERLQAIEDSLARNLHASLVSLAGADAPLRPLKEAVAEFERVYVSRALMELGGDARAARRVLAVSRATLYRALAEHGLQHLVKFHDPSGGDGE